MQGEGRGVPAPGSLVAAVFVTRNRIGSGRAGGTGIIRVVKDAALKQYGPEAYRLEAAPGNIVISAATPKGVYYAGQSLAQMLPAAFFNNGADKKSVSWNVAEKPFSILDYPVLPGEPSCWMKRGIFLERRR